MLYSELLRAALCKTLRHRQPELILRVESEGAFQEVTVCEESLKLSARQGQGTWYQKQEVIYEDFIESMESVNTWCSEDSPTVFHY